LIAKIDCYIDIKYTVLLHRQPQYEKSRNGIGTDVCRGLGKHWEVGIGLRPAADLRLMCKNYVHV